MKQFFKASSYVLATVIVLLFTGFSVLAESGTTNNGSSLSFIQVIGGFALLLLVIFLPLIKGSGKKEDVVRRS